MVAFGVTSVRVPQAAYAAISRATPPPAPAVITLSIFSAERAAKLLRAIYPHATVRVERAANAVIVVASQEDVSGMRAVASGIDVKNPTDATVDAIAIRTAKPGEVVARLQPLFRRARFIVAPNRTLVVAAGALDMAQIKTVVAAIDTPPPTPSPKPASPAQAVRVTQADPRLVARAIARAMPNIHVAVSGENVLISGAPDDVNQAKAVIAQLDQPQGGVQFTQVYRLHAVNAASVADLLAHSFRNVTIEADKDLNAISVFATTPLQQRISDAIAQLDASPNGGAATNAASGSGGGTNTEVITLRAAVPAVGGAASTSAADIAQSVTQALQGSASDLRITVHPNSTRLVLSGSPYSLQLARDLIAKLDTAEPLVELDTEVYEVDEGLQKQLGIKFPAAALGTTYTEVTPAANASGAASPLLGLQALTRTPLSLQAQLDFLVSTNKARILENPRITIFSGRTASLRAGETVNILTTTGGGTGTVATTQVQSFQTGVTLDITPVVNTDDYVTVTLHPSVNTVAGISAAGVPNIQTRDTTTTVGLHDGDTLVVGGLIEDADSRTVQKIPLLGDLPLIGRLFQDVGVSHTRNELVVTVTPHILKPGISGGTFAQALPKTPAGAVLPTLGPTATLPPVSSSRRAPPAPVVAAPIASQTLQPPSGPDGVPTLAPGAAPAPLSQSAAPTPTTSGPTPGPLPSAFAQTNTFTFGTSPANNYADQSQPPQIFFVQVQPTVIKNGQPVTIAAITTTNVATLSFGPSVTTSSESLGSIGPGKWQATFNFSTAGLPSVSGNVNMMLTATTTLGASVTVRLPFSLVNR